MDNKQILKNTPDGTTHVAFTYYDKSITYLQIATDGINKWYYWNEDSWQNVNFDLMSIYNNIRALDDIKAIEESEDVIRFL